VIVARSSIRCWLAGSIALTWFDKLRAGFGHVSVIRQKNPKTGRQQYWLSAEEITSFHGRFVML